MKAFECRICGECCFGEGGIFVGEEEAERIAVFLGVTSSEFTSQFCEERNGRLYIRTGEDGFCLYYDKEKSCLIHPVKPDRCSLWPFFPANVHDKDAWELAKEACPGINPDCPYEEFVRQAEKNQKP
jgi:Fe-S-cluster containining protein